MEVSSAATPALHLAGVQRYWLSKFTDEQLVELGALLARLEEDPGT